MRSVTQRKAQKHYQGAPADMAHSHCTAQAKWPKTALPREAAQIRDVLLEIKAEAIRYHKLHMPIVPKVLLCIYT